ncbi:hypothetical protein LZ32DRAFT_599122, partial [Colletotrichum eremochloae]
MKGPEGLVLALFLSGAEPDHHHSFPFRPKPSVPWLLLLVGRPPPSTLRLCLCLNRNYHPYPTTRAGLSTCFPFCKYLAHFGNTHLCQRNKIKRRTNGNAAARRI